MIVDRPIQVSDIPAFRREQGYSAADLAWILGMPPGKWGKLMRDARDRPCLPADPRHALLLRWLMRQPHPVLVSVRGPEPGAILRRLRDCADKPVTARDFALYLGCEASAGYRWLTRNGAIAPSGRRALAMLDHGDPMRLAENWSAWAANAHLEASLRGFDLTQAASWTRPSPPAGATS